MKRIIATVAPLVIGSALPLLAEVTTEETTTTADGSVTKTETKTTTFDPQSKTKIVKYFDTYKSEPHGLPPAWITKIKVKEIPSTWRTARITPGVVVSEKERAYLIAAPSDLISILPTPASGVRYYVAGSNVIAVDANYRVVDSIQVPSVKFTVEP